MPDIYNRNTDTFGGSFASDDASVTFPAISGGGSDVGLLMQALGASYQQQVTRLFEISSSAVYYVGGRTSGQASVQRVLGPRKIALAFYQTYGDICNAATNTIFFSLNAACDSTVGAVAAYTCHFVVVTNVAVNVAAMDMVVNESLQMMFSSMLYN